MPKVPKGSAPASKRPNPMSYAKGGTSMGMCRPWSQCDGFLNVPAIRVLYILDCFPFLSPGLFYSHSFSGSDIDVYMC